jgi:hypothetical protein
MLTAAAVGSLALTIAVIRIEREQFGVPIGSFQSLQHGPPTSRWRSTAQLLARKAAWALTDRDDAAQLAAMAFLFCAERRSTRPTGRCTTTAATGSWGVDIQLFYRRAKGCERARRTRREYARLADLRYGPVVTAVG